VAAAAEWREILSCFPQPEPAGKPAGQTAWTGCEAWARLGTQAGPSPVTASNISALAAGDLYAAHTLSDQIQEVAKRSATRRGRKVTAGSIYATAWGTTGSP
jgi:hypothetical protein